MHGMRRIPINSPSGLFILKIFAMREQTACAYTLTAVLIDGLPFFLPKILVDKSVLFQVSCYSSSGNTALYHRHFSRTF